MQRTESYATDRVLIYMHTKNELLTEIQSEGGGGDGGGDAR